MVGRSTSAGEIGVQFLVPALSWFTWGVVATAATYRMYPSPVLHVLCRMNLSAISSQAHLPTAPRISAALVTQSIIRAVEQQCVVHRALYEEEDDEDDLVAVLLVLLLLLDKP